MAGTLNKSNKKRQLLFHLKLLCDDLCHHSIDVSSPIQTTWRLRPKQSNLTIRYLTLRTTTVAHNNLKYKFNIYKYRIKIILTSNLNVFIFSIALYFIALQRLTKRLLRIFFFLIIVIASNDTDFTSIDQIVSIEYQRIKDTTPCDC